MYIYIYIIFIFIFTRIYPIYWYLFGQTPQFARADADDMSEHQKTLCFVGKNAYVHNHGFHLATHSLATCALNVTTTSSPSTSSCRV